MFRQEQPIVTIITAATGLGLSPYAVWADVQNCGPERTADVPWKDTGWHYKGMNYEAQKLLTGSGIQRVRYERSGVVGPHGAASA